MFRTPAKDKTFEVPHSPKAAERAGPAPIPSVRRSIEEWQTVGKKKNTPPRTPPKKKTASMAGPSRTNLKITLTQENRRPPVETSEGPTQKPMYPTRTAEARACLRSARNHLSSSKNLKAEIKAGVIEAVERLYELVMEDEEGRRGGGRGEEEPLHPPPISRPDPTPPPSREDNELRQRMEEHCRLMQENTKRMVELSDRLQEHGRALKAPSYASVAAGNGRPKPAVQATLHSVVVASKDEGDTAEQVLEKFRKVASVKYHGLNIDRVRKIKDGRILISCPSEDWRLKVKERLSTSDQLTAQDVQNKDPLLILRNVDITDFKDDNDLQTALVWQNEDLVFDMYKDDNPPPVRVMYRRKTRNPRLNHVVMRVPPLLWKRALKAGTIWMDLKRVRVADQSPLVQCSLCLGYGHTRRFCTETEEKCSHCAGPHKKTECPDWTTTTPTCCNCVQAKLEQTDHNAFNEACPIRQKWDALARAKTSYSCEDPEEAPHG